jgi:uncharacterized protein YacL
MKFILKLIGAFIIVHLTCVIIDVFSLGGFVVTAHVLSNFSLKNILWASVIAWLGLTIATILLKLLWSVGFVFCSNKSIIAAILLILFGLFRFIDYCAFVLSGETGNNEALAKLIEMAQDDAGDLYSLGAWASIAFAFIFYAIMCILIWSFSLDEE